MASSFISREVRVGRLGSEELAIAPLFASPCDLAHKLPPLVGDFLDLETSLRRRFREESVSDIVVASLLCLAGPDVSVQVPVDESKTGNDFDLVVFDPPRRAAVQYRIQAKRLTPHAAKWRMGSYVELAHPKNTGAQSRALIRSAVAERRIRTVPLYAFYNPSRACAASGGVLNGIELADGHAVRALVQHLVKSKPKRPPVKRLSTLQPLFFPLSTLLCPPSDETGRRVPTPEGSLRTVAAAARAGIVRLRGQTSSLPSKLLSDATEDAGDAANASLEGSAELPSFLELAVRARGQTVGVTRIKAPRPRVILFSDTI